MYLYNLSYRKDGQDFMKVKKTKKITKYGKYRSYADGYKYNYICVIFEDARREKGYIDEQLLTNDYEEAHKYADVNADYMPDEEDRVLGFCEVIDVHNRRMAMDVEGYEEYQIDDKEWNRLMDMLYDNFASPYDHDPEFDSDCD